MNYYFVKKDILLFPLTYAVRKGGYTPSFMGRQEEWEEECHFRQNILYNYETFLHAFLPYHVAFCPRRLVVKQWGGRWDWEKAEQTPWEHFHTTHTNRRSPQPTHSSHRHAIAFIPILPYPHTLYKDRKEGGKTSTSLKEEHCACFLHSTHAEDTFEGLLILWPEPPLRVLKEEKE